MVLIGKSKQKLIIFSILFISFVGIIEGNASEQEDPLAMQKEIQLMLASRNLTAEQAEELEKQAAANPDSFESRLQLLSFYQTARLTNPQYQAAHQKHVMWVINNNANSTNPTLAALLVLLPQFDDQQFSEQVKELWLHQTEKFKDVPAVFKNAGMSLILYDRETAKSLLKQGQLLDPADPTWGIFLSQAYNMDGMTDEAGKTKTESAQLAYQVISNSSESLAEKDVYYQLADMAKTAFESGNFTKAQEHAQELLRQASIQTRDWNYGNAIHHGNLILGRVALKNGKLQEAKNYLLKAGETPGSPQLDSFGPNMSLAKELLENNEQQSVLQFFELCSKFWEMGTDRLKEWTDLVNHGKVPDFGANLNY